MVSLVGTIGRAHRISSFGSAKLIRSSEVYAGKTVLICWNHESIPELMAALRIKPKPN